MSCFSCLTLQTKDTKVDIDDAPRSKSRYSSESSGSFFLSYPFFVLKFFENFATFCFMIEFIIGVERSVSIGYIIFFNYLVLIRMLWWTRLLLLR